MGEKRYGFVAISRGFLEHRLLARKRKRGERWAETDVFLWFLFEAAWKAECRRGAQLKRGQLVGSLREWAKQFRWPKSTMADYLAHAVAEGTIKLDKISKRTFHGTNARPFGRGAMTLLTFCNYEKHQPLLRAARKAAGQSGGHLPGQFSADAIVQHDLFGVETLEPTDNQKKESGEERTRERSKPRDGQTSVDGKWIFFAYGSETWQQYAADEEAIKGAIPVPKIYRDGRGNWFYKLGAALAPKKNRKHA